MDLAKIERLLELLADRDVREFTYEDAEVKLRLRYGAEVVAAPVMAAHLHAPVVAGPVSAAPASPTPAAADNGARTVTVEAPMVGTLYRAPSPGAKNYVEIGDRVQKGQVLCIIEAMKLMNELEADVSGKVTAILVDNASPVQFGQALFLIEPA